MPGQLGPLSARAIPVASPATPVVCFVPIGVFALIPAIDIRLAAQPWPARARAAARRVAPAVAGEANRSPPYPASGREDARWRGRFFLLLLLGRSDFGLRWSRDGGLLYALGWPRGRSDRAGADKHPLLAARAFDVSPQQIVRNPDFLAQCPQRNLIIARSPQRKGASAHHRHLNVSGKVPEIRGSAVARAIGS